MVIKLPPRQIDQFYDIGYITLENVFSENEVAEMRATIDRLQHVAQTFGDIEDKILHKGSEFVVAKQEGTHQIKRVVWCGAAEQILLQYGRDPRLTSIAGQIMGCTQAEHLINQVHFKLPHDGVFFPFHQDSQHRRYGTDLWTDVNGKGSYVQIMTAIDEITMENGPPLFIPGSCTKGHLRLPYYQDQETISELFNPHDAVPALLQQGDIVAFGPYVIHGSMPNTSSMPRRLFINGFAYPGANKRVYPGEGAGALIDLAVSDKEK